MISLARLFSLMKREAVLSAAAALALLSMLWVPPDGAYLSYVDWRTMAQLFCLMAVMAGLRELGVFSRLGRQLLCRVRSARQLECVLVFLCFFTSMAITNDVALLTFVPFSLEVLTLAGREERAVPVVVFQTVAANLGSMATPIGNPQNLYLYAQSGRGLGDFLALMLPYTLLSGLMLLLCLLPGRSAPLAGLAPGGAEPSLRRRRTGMYLLLFLASVSSVAKLLPVWLLTAAVVVCVLAADRRVLRRVDWSLLATFVGFFLFVGNLSRLPACHDFFRAVLAHHEAVCAVLASQALSNVPAALLLSGFTDNGTALLVGTNLGGLGTLIASMASLISYKQVVRRSPYKKGKYLLWFTAANLVFLTILLSGYLLLAL